MVELSQNGFIHRPKHQGQVRLTKGEREFWFKIFKIFSEVRRLLISKFTKHKPLKHFDTGETEP